MISNLDGQQVEEQLKIAERRMGDIERRMQRKLHLVQSTCQGYESAAADVTQLTHWVAERSALVNEKKPLGFRAKNIEMKLLQIKVRYVRSFSFRIYFKMVHFNCLHTGPW